MRHSSAPAIAVIVMVVVLFLLPLYFLSIGPAWWLNLHTAGTGRTFATIYFPLIELGEVSPAFSHILSAYMDLWGNLVPIEIIARF